MHLGAYEHRLEVRAGDDEPRDKLHQSMDARARCWLHSELSSGPHSPSLAMLVKVAPQNLGKLCLADDLFMPPFGQEAAAVMMTAKGICSFFQLATGELSPLRLEYF